MYYNNHKFKQCNKWNMNHTHQLCTFSSVSSEQGVMGSSSVCSSSSSSSNSLINAARTGQLKNRISQGELVGLLEKDAERKGEQKVVVRHVRHSSSGGASMTSGDLQIRLNTVIWLSGLATQYNLNHFMQLTPIKQSCLKDRRNQLITQLRTEQRNSLKNRTRNDMMEHYARIDLDGLIA